MRTPEYSAGVEAWELKRFTGRLVWAKPETAAETTPAAWCSLLEVWMEVDRGDSFIAAFIEWEGETRRSHQWTMNNRVQVELIAAENAGVRVVELPGGYTSRLYDPWADGPSPGLAQYRRKRPEPKPTSEPTVTPTEFGDQFTIPI